MGWRIDKLGKRVLNISTVKKSLPNTIVHECIQLVQVRRLERRTVFLLLTLLIALFEPFLIPPKVSAGQAQMVIMRFDRIKASTATGGTVCLKPNTTMTDIADIQVQFPSDFTLNTTGSNYSTTTTNLPLSASAMPNIANTATLSGQLVTWAISAATTLTAGTLYCFNFSGTSTITNPTAGNDKTGFIRSRNVAQVVIDTGNYGTSVVSNDQISLTASVSATFSLTYSFDDDGTGVDNFNNNVGSSVVASSDGTSITVSTNAGSGWVAWVKSANAALSSTLTGESMSSPGTINDTPESLAAQEGYVLDVDATTDSGTGDGTLSIDAEYLGANLNEGGHLATTFQEAAYGSGTTAGDVITLIARAKASAVRAAANDYTDTLTVVAAGRF